MWHCACAPVKALAIYIYEGRSGGVLCLVWAEAAMVMGTAGCVGSGVMSEDGRIAVRKNTPFFLVFK